MSIVLVRFDGTLQQRPQIAVLQWIEVVRPLRRFIIFCRIFFCVDVEGVSIFIVKSGRRLDMLAGIRILNDNRSRELVGRYSVLRNRNDGLVDNE